jgi:hypothetical protein
MLVRAFRARHEEYGKTKAVKARHCARVVHHRLRARFKRNISDGMVGSSVPAQCTAGDGWNAETGDEP